MEKKIFTIDSLAISQHWFPFVTTFPSESFWIIDKKTTFSAQSFPVKHDNLLMDGFPIAYVEPSLEMYNYGGIV